MYELDDYLAMVEDGVRTPAYLEAMARTIRPGDRVLELGTGFGYFAVHACRLGASHVIAVEPNDAVAHARAVAEANGCADRITFVQGFAERLALPDRADVLVEDLRGISPLHGARLDVLRDAKARLLVPGARRVPLRDELLIAPSEVPGDLGRLAVEAPTVVHGIDVSAVRALLRQSVHRTRADATALLAEGAVWARLDLGALPDTDPRGGATFTIARDGTLAGLVSWFATTLADGVAYDTGPSSGRTVYDRAFLPLESPLAVHAGDEVQVEVRTRFDGGDYVWVWDVLLRRAAGGEARQRGSNLASRAMSAARRARRAAEHVPARSATVVRAERLLSLVDGARSLDAIAEALRQAEPGAFAAPQEALRWAGEHLARLDEGPWR